MTRPSGSRWSSMPGICSIQEAAAGDLKHRLQAVGGRLVRRENAEVAGVHVQLHHVPDVGAEDIHILRLHRAGGLARPRHSPGNRGCADRAAAVRRWRGGSRPCGGLPAGGKAATSSTGRAVGVEELLRLVGAQPLLQLGKVAVSVRAHERWAPDGPASSPRRAGRRTSLGPVQPLGVRSTSMGQRGRFASPLLRAVPLDALDLTDGPVQRRSHLLVHLPWARRPPRSAAPSRSRGRSSPPPRGSCGRRWWGWRS